MTGVLAKKGITERFSFLLLVRKEGTGVMLTALGLLSSGLSRDGTSISRLQESLMTEQRQNSFSVPHRVCEWMGTYYFLEVNRQVDNRQTNHPKGDQLFKD